MLGDLARECPSCAAEALLGDLFDLPESGFIVLQQLPISALGQGFRGRVIVPSGPKDVAGDLTAEFAAAMQKVGYARSTHLLNDEDIGIPFGIYAQLTPAGQGHHLLDGTTLEVPDGSIIGSISGPLER